MKLTIKKRMSEEAGRREKRNAEKEISKLVGKEKLKYDISVLKSRIFNVKEDIKKFGSNSNFTNKLFSLEEQLELLKEGI